MSRFWDMGFSAATSASQSRKAVGVETPTSGTATTHHVLGKSGIGTTNSPRPSPKTAPPNRNKGTSDPTSAANFNRSTPGSATPSSRSNPIKAAAALADPAPIPPCTGRFF